QPVRHERSVLDVVADAPAGQRLLRVGPGSGDHVRQTRARHGLDHLRGRRRHRGQDPCRHRRRRQAPAVVRQRGAGRGRRGRGAGTQAGLRATQATPAAGPARAHRRWPIRALTGGPARHARSTPAPKQAPAQAYNPRMSPDANAPQRASPQRLFLTGLLTLLPIWLTWVVVKFVFVLLSGISSPWVVPLSQKIAGSFPDSLGWVQALWVQNTIAMLATLLVILGVGLLARRVIGQRLLRQFEAVIARVPLANIIYTSSRKLLDILQTKPGSTQRVVLIDFPHRDMKAIGLVTRVLREEGSGRELAAVYVP